MISLLKSKSSSPACRACFLSADKLAVYHWQNGKLGSSYLFDVSGDGQNYFARYLKDTPNIPVYLLVDVLEEEYRQDTIPHVFGADRTALINRKISRLFRDTPYFYAENQGREEGGRRDDRMFFMGLTNPGFLTPWLNLLDQYKVPLAGIYSVPQLTQTILDIIPNPAEHMLVVSLQSISGLRQSFFHKNKLRISRLVSMPRYGTQPYGKYIVEEIETIHRYLKGLHLAIENKPLDVYFLGNENLLVELKQLYANSILLNHHFIDIAILARNAKIGSDITTPFCDPLLIYHLLKRKPANFYASSSERRYYKFQKMRQFMMAASIFMVLSSVILGGLNFMKGMVYKQQSNIAVKEKEYYQARYDIARVKLPETPVSPADLELIVNMGKTLADYKATPFNVLNLVSRGLDKYPSIRIEELLWAFSTNPNMKFDGAAIQSDDQAVLGLSNVDAPEDYQYYQIASIKGYIQQFDGNYRAALSLVDQFASAYREMESVHNVSVLSLPLDISSDVSLQGADNAGPGKANFSMRIVMGIKHGT